MTNSRIDYLIKRKKFYNAKCKRDSSFKTLTTRERITPKTAGKKVNFFKDLYPKEWDYLVSNDKRPETTTFEDFKKIKLKDGDKVFFEAGQIYNLADYDLAATVEFGRFGAGADPIFRPSDDISGLSWTDEGGGVYSASMAVEPNWVWINGVAAKLAETARIAIVTRPSFTVITIADADVSGYTTIIGSYLVAKETNFKQSQRVTVTNYNPANGNITVDGEIEAPTSGPLNVDLVLYNKIEYLTGNNEWAWESGTLYIKAAASPSTLDIRITDSTYGIKNTSGTLTMSDIEMTQYYTAGVWANGGNVNITDCNFHDIRDTSVIIQTAVTGAVISNNAITRSGNCGVFVRPCTTSTFSNNTFQDIGMDENYGWQTWTSGDGSLDLGGTQTNGAAIVYLIDLDDDTVDGSGGCTYEYNVIDNTAYNGISIHTGQSPTIRYNTITNYMERFEDGAAIYTFHYRLYDVPLEGVEIAYNNITGDEDVHLSAGIYIDNRTIESNIHHNTIISCKNGIYLNFDTFGHTVEDNNIFSCLDYGIAIVSGVSGVNYENNTANNVNRNVIACETVTEKFMQFAIQSGSFPSWNPYTGGGADNNYYVRAAGPSAGNGFDSIAGNNRTLAQIQTEWGQDASSVYRAYNPEIVLNNTDAISNEDAESYYRDLDNNTLTTYTIAARYSRIIAEKHYSNQLVASSSQNYNGGTAADIQVAHNTAMSFSFWVKFASNPGATVSIIDNRNGSNQGFVAQLLSSGFSQNQFVNTVSTNRLQLVDDVDIADNAWHHVLVTKPAATFSNSKIFIDGVNASASIFDNLTATIASTADFLIGLNPNTAVYTDMLIADIAIWNADVSALALNIYGSNTPGSGRIIDLMQALTTKPIHYWRMGLTNSLLDVGTSATKMNLTGVNSPTSSTDVP